MKKIWKNLDLNCSNLKPKFCCFSGTAYRIHLQSQQPATKREAEEKIQSKTFVAYSQIIVWEIFFSRTAASLSTEILWQPPLPILAKHIITMEIERDMKLQQITSYNIAIISKCDTRVGSLWIWGENMMPERALRKSRCLKVLWYWFSASISC